MWRFYWLCRKFGRVFKILFRSILNPFSNSIDFISVFFIILNDSFSRFFNTSKSVILPYSSITEIYRLVFHQLSFVKLMSIYDSNWWEGREMKFKLVAPAFLELSLFMLTPDNTLSNRWRKLLNHWTDVIFVTFGGHRRLQGFQSFKTFLRWK